MGNTRVCPIAGILVERYTYRILLIKSVRQRAYVPRNALSVAHNLTARNGKYESMSHRGYFLSIFHLELGVEFYKSVLIQKQKKHKVMSKIKSIITSYILHSYPESVSREFADWFTDPTDAEQKDAQMLSEWERIVVKPNKATTKQGYDSVMARITKSDNRVLRNKIIESFSRVAAIVVIALALVAIAHTIFKSERVEWQEVYVARAESRVVTLEDGSVFRLAPGSRLIYPSKFDSNVRRVYLSGEAYADIAKDQMRRFIVSADQIDVVVHGTRFNIRSYESNSEVELLLLEGSIDMQTKSLKENRVVRMYPGNLVKLDKHSGRIICDNIPSDMFDDDPAARNLTFVNSRLGDIASQLERLFDVRIVIDQASLADERYYSAFVNNESLDRILSTLEQNGTMSYYWRGGEIHLRKK